MSGPDRPEAERDVLSNLPHSRPHRRSAKRGGRVAQTTSKAAEAVEASESAVDTPKPADAVKPASRPAPAKPKAKPATGSSARPGDSTASRAQRLRKPPPPPGPLPPRAGETAPPKREGPPGGTELVGTVVQAAGELAQVGLTIGGQVLKRAISRLPKP